MTNSYLGPISAAIHINDDEHKENELNLLYQALKENPDMKKYVDIHLIMDKYDRQFNMWRNTAKLYTRTDYLMMLDIDFYLCTDFRTHILQNPNLMSLLRQGQTALVVPAFEYLDQSDGIDYSTFPETKQDLLLQIFDQPKLDMFHVTWERGHSATNYMKWYTAETAYKVTEYNFSYEPYVIFKKQGSPWCDERFIGYGANKAACLYEIYLSGIDYYVLPDDFLIHQSHHYPESTRKKEVKELKKKEFKNSTNKVINSVCLTEKSIPILEKNFVSVTHVNLLRMVNGILPALIIYVLNVKKFVDLLMSLPTLTNNFNL